jgi:hypothetical protein
MARSKFARNGRVVLFPGLSWEVRSASEKPLLHLWPENYSLTRRVLATSDHSDQRLALLVEPFDAANLTVSNLFALNSSPARPIPRGFLLWPRRSLGGSHLDVASGNSSFLWSFSPYSLACEMPCSEFPRHSRIIFIRPRGAHIGFFRHHPAFGTSFSHRSSGPSHFFRSRRAARKCHSPSRRRPQAHRPQPERIAVFGQFRNRRTRAYLCNGAQKWGGNEGCRIISQRRGNSESHSSLPAVPGISGRTSRITKFLRRR